LIYHIPVVVFPPVDCTGALEAVEYTMSIGVFGTVMNTFIAYGIVEILALWKIWHVYSVKLHLVFSAKNS